MVSFGSIKENSKHTKKKETEHEVKKEKYAREEEEY